MKYNNKFLKYSLCVMLVGIAFLGCQKMDRPVLGDYPKDTNPPGGPLKFYAAFDGTTDNPLMNAVDSIRANFPSDNPLPAVPGVSGNGIQGDPDPDHFVKYAGANDFPSTASSFTVSLWEKRNGIPNGNAAFVFTIPSSNGWWGDYGFSMFLLFDWGSWTPASSATVKFYMVDDKTKSDSWLTWEGDNKVPNIQDNNWHHLAFVYDATTSNLTLYVDGVANSHVPQWTGHGGLSIDPGKVQGLDISGNANIHDMGWGQSWDGALDQFRLYSKALSADEVKALYDSKL